MMRNEDETTYKQATAAVAKIETYLVGRDWCIDGELGRIVEQANAQIERIQTEAIRAIVRKLERYKFEADQWARNEMTDLDDNPEPISKREQQKSRMDSRHIKATIDKTGSMQ